MTVTNGYKKAAEYIVAQIAPELDYIYYTHKPAADKMARALRIITGGKWTVKKVLGKYWVMKG